MEVFGPSSQACGSVFSSEGRPGEWGVVMKSSGGLLGRQQCLCLSSFGGAVVARGRLKWDEERMGHEEPASGHFLREVF